MSNTPVPISTSTLSSGTHRKCPSSVLPFLIVTACSGESASSDVDVVRTMRGDTLVIRTLAGSVWSAQPEWRPVLSIGGLDGPAETSFGELAFPADA